MIKTRMMRKGLMLIALNLLLALAVYLAGYNTIAINFEAALFPSMLIVLGNLKGYQLLVERSIEHDIGSEYRDVIEKIEDPYDLYEEDDVNKLELNKIKPQHVNNLIKTKAGFLSKGRILGYVLLIASLFALKNSGLFHIPSYLFGLAFGIIIALILGKATLQEEKRS